MKRLLTLLFIGLPYWVSAQSDEYDPYRLYTPTQLQEDLAVLQRAFVQLHPGLYRYTSPDSLNLAYRQAVAQIDRSMHDVEFGLLLRPYIGRVRCAHTGLSISKERQRYLRQLRQPPLPLSLLVRGDKLFVATQPMQATGVSAFEEIAALDGRPATELIRQFRPMVWGDGYTQTASDGMLSMLMPALYRAAYGYQDTLTVQLTDSTGRLRKVALPTRGVSARRLARYAKADTVRRQRSALPTRTVLNRRGIRLSVVREDSAIAVLKIDRFADGPMRRAFAAAFKEIKRREIRQLIVDVRGNLGGSAQTCRDLVRYVATQPFVFWDSTVANARTARIPGVKTWLSSPFAYIDLRFRLRRDDHGNLQLPTYRKTVRPYENRRFTGPVYILTDGLSFSAGSIFPALARQYNPNVRIVGRETGGGAYGCNAGQSIFVQLPNTRMVVKIPAYRIRLPLPGRDQGRGVMPDYPVAYSLDDLRQGRDRDLETARQLMSRDRATSNALSNSR
ncbi:S41 family peptidase [Rudanella lutea]|uniref:S41 family peptidase n=1 Tax=Rudanella lutea TaxID=451374 RepID=UPI000364F0AE|nr:S41 family peptidase [Rudanella lutea]